MRAAAARPESGGVGRGLGVRPPTGVGGVYDRLVPELVRRGFLPPEALGGAGVSAWRWLQTLSPTGRELTGSGVVYDNWRRVNSWVSELAGSGLGLGTLVLTHPDGSELAIDGGMPAGPELADVVGRRVAEVADSLVGGDGPSEVLVDAVAAMVRADEVLRRSALGPPGAAGWVGRSGLVEVLVRGREALDGAVGTGAGPGPGPGDEVRNWLEGLHSRARADSRNAWAGAVASGLGDGEALAATRAAYRAVVAGEVRLRQLVQAGVLAELATGRLAAVSVREAEEARDAKASAWARVGVLASEARAASAPGGVAGPAGEVSAAPSDWPSVALRYAETKLDVVFDGAFADFLVEAERVHEVVEALGLMRSLEVVSERLRATAPAPALEPVLTATQRAQREAALDATAQWAAIVEVFGPVRGELRRAADNGSYVPAVSTKMRELYERAAAAARSMPDAERQRAEYIRVVRQEIPAVLSGDLLRVWLMAKWLLDQAEKMTPDLRWRGWQTLEQTRQRLADERARRRWWTPGKGHGFGFGTPKSLTGVDETYNGLVPVLVGRGFLPVQALGGKGVSPWQRLQGLSPTGVELNQPGVEYANWRLVVDLVSESTLLGRSDDAGGSGVPLTLTHPDGSLEMISVSVGVHGPGRFVRDDDMMPINTFQGLDEVRVRRTTAGTSDRAPLEGGVVLDPGGEGPRVDGVSTGFFGGRLSGWRKVRRAGEKVSSNVITYTRATGRTSLYDLPVRLQWEVGVGSWNLVTGQVAGRAQVWQPSSMADGLAETPLPDLDVSDEGTASPLTGLTMRAPVTTSGLDELQYAAAEVFPKAGQARRWHKRLVGLLPAVAQWFVRTVWRGLTKRWVSQAVAARSAVARPHPGRPGLRPVREALTTLWYKTNLPRILSSGSSLSIGGEPAMVVARPVGRPQVVKEVKVYSEHTLESQAGRETEDDTGKVRGWGGTTGYQPGLVEQAVALWQRLTGLGGSVGQGRTEGSYRTLTDTTEMYLVRTAVDNTLTYGSGDPVTRRGEVFVLVSKKDLLAHPDRAGFDDPRGVLKKEPARAPAPPVPARTAPRSLRDGHLWSTATFETIGKSPMHDALAADADKLGGQRLRVQVLPLLTGVGAFLPSLPEADRARTVKAGGKKWEFVLGAKTDGDPVYVQDLDAAGLKMYTRSNDFTNTKDRQSTADTVGVAGGVQPGAEVLVTVNASHTQTVITEDGQEIVYNMLTMDGVRPKGVAEFSQPISYTYRLRRVYSWYNVVGRAFDWMWAGGLVADTGRRSGFTETRRLFVPQEGSPTRVAEPEVAKPPQEGSPTRVADHEVAKPPDPAWKGVRLTNELPQYRAVQGVSRIEDIDSAVRRTGRFRSLPRGTVKPSLRALDHESLIARFPRILASGGRFSYITTAAGEIKVRGGVDVAAEIGEPHHIYRVNTAELEHYDHITEGVSEGQLRGIRRAWDWVVALFFPLEWTATWWAGPRFAGGSGVADTRGQSVNRSTEHRSWLRQMVPVYSVYAPVTFTLTLSDTWWSRLRAGGRN